MRIEIVRVHDAGDAFTDVAFSCASGEAIGHWAGVRPAAGDVRHVEFGCDEELVPGVNAIRSVSRVPSLRHHQDRIEITAQLLSQYEEGTVLLGFDDGRLDVEVEGDAFWCVNEWYTITLGGLKLYDMNL